MMDYKQAAVCLKVFANAERLKLLRVLAAAHDGLPVKGLSEIARVNQFTAIDHLRRMVAAGVVTNRMEKPRRSIYRLAPEFRALLNAIAPPSFSYAVPASPFRVAEYVNGLANWDRLAMVDLLLVADRTFGELFAAVDVKQAHAVEHVQRLRLAGVVKKRKAGRRTVYRLIDPARCRAILDCLQVTDRPTMIQRLRLEYRTPR